METVNNNSSITVFQCSACKLYFQDYSKATLHLALNHMTECKNALAASNSEENGGGDTHKTPTRSRDEQQNEEKKSPRTIPLLETIEFFHPILLLERAQPQKKVKVKSAARPKSKAFFAPAPIEIKLETMKASEIEALMNDLYRNPQQQVASSSINTPVRISKPAAAASTSSSRRVSDVSGRSLRQTSPQFYDGITYSDDEEPVKKKRRVKKSVVKNEAEEKDAESDKDFKEEKQTRKKKTFYCNVCHIQFSLNQQPQYSEHMRVNHLITESDGKAQYICPECNTGWFPLTMFNRHFNKAHKRRNKKNAKRNPAKVIPPKKPFNCNLKRCKESFETQEDLYRHHTTHDEDEDAGKKQVKCPVCHIRLSHRYALQRHMTRHLTHNPFVCKFTGCEKSFNGEYNLRRHVILHTSAGREKEVFRCTQCPAKYTRPNKLRDHLELHKMKGGGRVRIRKSESYRIKAVSENKEDQQNLFKAPEALAALKKDDPNDPRVELESVHFSDHVLTEGKFSIKEESFSPPAYVDEEQDDLDSDPEVNTETDEYKQQQKEMEAKFMADPVVKKLMKDNPEMVHSLFLPGVSQKNTKYKCDKCDWVGTRINFLREHMEKWHKEELPNVNLDNDEEEGDPSQLKFMCGACGYVTKTSEDLSKHLTDEHIKGKSFHCTFCGYKFATQNQKQDHEKRVHLSAKKFPCGKCTRKFSSQQHLNLHMKEAHDKAYQKKNLFCGKCKKTMSNRAALNQHMRRIHSEVIKTVSCKTCGQVCATATTLKRHISYVHLKVINPYNKKKQEINRNKKMAKAKENGHAEATTTANLETPSLVDVPQETEESKRSEIFGF